MSSSDMVPSMENVVYHKKSEEPRIWFYFESPIHLHITRANITRNGLKSKIRGFFSRYKREIWQNYNITVNGYSSELKHMDHNGKKFETRECFGYGEDKHYDVPEVLLSDIDHVTYTDTYYFNKKHFNGKKIKHKTVWKRF